MYRYVKSTHSPVHYAACIAWRCIDTRMLAAPGSHRFEAKRSEWSWGCALIDLILIWFVRYIKRIDLSTKEVTVLHEGGLNNPHCIAVNPSTLDLAVCDKGNDRVVQLACLHPASGPQ